MKKTFIICSLLFISCIATFAQTHKAFRIDYHIFGPAEDGENANDEPVITAWVNNDFIKIQPLGEDPTIILHTKRDKKTVFMNALQQQYILVDPELIASATANDYPITFVKGQQKEIAGYTCKLAQVSINDTEEEDTPTIIDVWYTEKLPNLYWGDFEYLEKIPGAMLSISVEGNGFRAQNVQAEEVAASEFTIPEDYEKVDYIASDMEEYEEDEESNELGYGLFQYLDEETNLYGIQDEAGNKITAALYARINIFEDNMSIVTNADYQTGVIDLKGKTVLPFIYEYLSYDSEGKLFIFSKEELFGLMDVKSKIIVPAKYQMITTFDYGLCLFVEGENMGVMNLKGEILVPGIEGSISGHSATHFVLVETDGTYSLYSIQGAKRLAKGLAYLGVTDEPNIFIAMKNDKYGYLDETGKLIIPFIYSSATIFSDGIASVYMEDSDESFYIDTKGKRIPVPTMD